MYKAIMARSYTPPLFACILLLAVSVRAASRTGYSRGLLEAKSAGPICAPSNLGYQCFKQACGKIQLHWSLGGAGPDADCTFTQPQNSSNGALDDKASVIHFALQTDLTGYVATAFPTVPRSMFPADAVIGWLENATADVQPYYLRTKKDHTDRNYPDETMKLENAKATFQDGLLTICFTRNVSAVGKAGIQVHLSKPMAINFAASRNHGAVDHEFERGEYLCSKYITFVSRLSTASDASELAENIPGATNESEDQVNCNAHGALMLVSWMVLVPTGILAAHHKALLPAPRWFQVHRASQLMACLLILIAFIIPFRTFASEVDLDDASRLVRAHGGIGIFVFSALCAHIVLAFVRPKPDHEKRWMWNLAHHWNGRIMFCFAVLNIFLGAKQSSVRFGMNPAKWIVPAVILLVAAVFAHFWLRKKQRQQGGEYASMSDGGASVSMAPMFSFGK